MICEYSYWLGRRLGNSSLIRVFGLTAGKLCETGHFGVNQHKKSIASGEYDGDYLDIVNVLNSRENSIATPLMDCSILLTVPSPLRIRVSECPVISGGRYR